MYKVSIVIPVYNVEKTIVRCAKSLFNQTLDDMQFIFVDDASPDKSVLLLEQTLERFPLRKKQTIILHHSRNKGLPTARATGLAAVEAPYVAHCDSDDYVEPVMYEKLYECAIQNNSDMVICGLKEHDIDGKEFAFIDNHVPGNSLINDFLCCRLSPTVWARLTRTEIYRRVHFPTESIQEDLVQTIQLLTYAARITFIPDCLYHYVRNPSSLTKDIRPDVIEEKMRQAIVNYHWIHDFIMDHHQVEEKDFIPRKASILLIYFPLIAKPGIRHKYLHTFPEINISLLFNRNVSLRLKVSHLLILLGLFPVARRIYLSFHKHLLDTR